MREWTATLGALYDGRGTTFRVWAPEHQRVELVLEGGGGTLAARALDREPNGCWTARFDDVAAGAHYRYRLDGDPGRTFPDPAARFQPEGVHGPSEVIDPRAFAWTDRGWRSHPLDALVFYELHVGTFTPRGTFCAIIEQLPHLVDLGVTAIELMPVGDFAGDRNWGYDGVAIFAPARCYGRPDDLRQLVDAAHQRGLAVFLDVVYNHLGPDGAYANAFSRHYFTDAHRSAWGSGVNLDGPHSPEVRRFFIENALHWVHEYHIDGLRLDATHALRDDSPRHFLAELTATVRDAAERPVLFVAEDHRNLDRMLKPEAAGGYGIDAVWADDLHHELRVHTARDRESYFGDFAGTTVDIATTIRQGWFYTGQHSAHQGETRGTDPSALAPSQFVVCAQNHDQVGNRADGARLNHHVDEATFRAVTVLLMTVPETPLLFMGQEWGASTPFLFFTHHHRDLGRLITEGRREEFRAFAAFADEAGRAAIPDPQEVETFAASRLRWDERTRAPHACVLRLHKQLLALRRTEAAWRQPSRTSFDAAAVDDHTVVLRLRPPQGGGRDQLVVVARLSGAGTVPIDRRGELVLTTEAIGISNDPRPVVITDTEIVFSRPGAVILRQPLA